MVLIFNSLTQSHTPVYTARPLVHGWWLGIAITSWPECCGWLLTHLSANWAQYRLTLLMQPTTLTTKSNQYHYIGLELIV